MSHAICRRRAPGHKRCSDWCWRANGRWDTAGMTVFGAPRRARRLMTAAADDSAGGLASVPVGCKTQGSSPASQLLPPPPSPPSSTLTTYPWSVALVSGLYATASLALVRSLVVALRTEPLFPDAFATVAASPWTLATLADFGVGVIAAAAYIAVREAYDDAADAASAAAADEGLLGADAALPRRGILSSWAVRAAAWTAGMCCLGNPVVCVYAVTKMVGLRGVSAGLLPAAESDGSVVSGRDGRDDAPSPSVRQRWPMLVLMAATVVGVAFVAICLWAAIVEGSAGWTYLRTNPWATATFLDNAVGLTVSGTYLWVRERGSGGWRRGAWMGALLAGGNAAIAAYVATLAMEGMREGQAPAAVVLGRRRRTE